MNKLFLFVYLIICFSFNIFGQNDTIKWSAKRLLSLDDFMAPMDTTSPYRALSDVGCKYKIVTKGDTVSYKGYCYFFKPSSRFNIKDKYKPTKIDLYLLKHEQVHFNIEELYLRMLKKKITETCFLKSTFKNTFSLLIKNYENQAKEAQKIYDKETNLSRNEKKQEEWNKKIAKQLKDLEAYSSDIIKAPLKK
jgi:hypothetical protein